MPGPGARGGPASSDLFAGGGPASFGDQRQARGSNEGKRERQSKTERDDIYA